MTKGKKTYMHRLRECIYRLRLNHSLRKINKELGIYRPILRNIRDLASKKGWLDPDSCMPDDQEIDAAWNERSNKNKPSSILDPYHAQIKEWHVQNYSAVVIHNLLKERVACSISQLRRYLKRHFAEEPQPIMVRHTYPGEVMDVDFGFMGSFWDTKQSRLRKTWVFSARLRHSRKAYREVVFDQGTITFITCHIHAFEWFGGVPAKVVLDNLKAGVIKSTIDNDQLNRSYQGMAEHYHILIDPCLPNTPQHKGGVESDIGYIKKSFLPLVREKQKYFPQMDLYALQQELEKWDREVADIRIVYGVGRSPNEIFREEEKDSLKPLPDCRWDIVQWHQCEVKRDWRIMYDSAYYSVPYFLIGQTIEIMATSSRIRIFFEHNQVASHPRATQKWEYLRNAHHAPPFKEVVLSCTREGLLIQSQEIGPHTFALAEKILSNPSVDKLRPIRKLLALVISYSKERLDKACKRALHYNTLSYQSVKNILENGLEEEPLKQVRSKIQPLFKHARDPREYQTKKEVSRG
jgi:Integrase core domain